MRKFQLLMGTHGARSASEASAPILACASGSADRQRCVKFALVLLMLTACSDKPTPVAFSVPPKPVVEVSPMAERVLRQIAAEQKIEEPWFVRLSIVWKAEPEIEVTLDHTVPKPDDFTCSAGGLQVVLARELLPYLRGSRIEMVNVQGGSGFDVTFPNRDAQDREAAGKWLREQQALRKSKGP
jgi:Fe-S cluster assembly iron-binding protein IscA